MKYFDYPPVWLLAFMALAWGSAKLGLEMDLPAWVGLSGRLLILFGISLMVLAAFAMWRHRTTLVPHRVPAAIVTNGVYKFTRNPIYLGDAFTLAGFSLLCGNLAGVALVPVFMAVIRRRFIAEEENWLRTKFHEEFQTWAESTRRWL